MTADDKPRRKPIFMLSTAGKSAEQIKAEAQQALREYREAQERSRIAESDQSEPD